MNNLLPYPSEFVYNESETILYWCQFGTDKCKRLANFEVIISRRFRLVSCDKAVDALGIVLRGRKSRQSPTGRSLSSIRVGSIRENCK